MRTHRTRSLLPSFRRAAACLVTAGLALASCGGQAGGGAEVASADMVAGQEGSTAGAGEWEVLFDGTDLSHWRGYRSEEMPAGWQVEEGTLAFVPGEGGGDIVTRDVYGDFELELEWRVAPGSNSGIFYRATEEEAYIFMTGAEMQVLDNGGHADGESPLTSAGSNFGLYPAEPDATRPVGEWNRARIVARGPTVEHWLNGTRVVSYEQGGEDWRARVADSKFAAWPRYGRAMEGHIGLQDHGDPVWYRNIRIRRLEDGR